jgi:hypothetical protein
VLGLLAAAFVITTARSRRDAGGRSLR